MVSFLYYWTTALVVLLCRRVDLGVEQLPSANSLGAHHKTSSVPLMKLQI